MKHLEDSSNRTQFLFFVCITTALAALSVLTGLKRIDFGLNGSHTQPLLFASLLTGAICYVSYIIDIRNKLTLLDVTTQASPPHPTASLLNLLNRLS